jgi:dTDP-4-amino-4,6-dideoxygalactose transaminase
VLVPDFTFPASANAVELAGATPVLVDIDLATFNLDVRGIRPALTSRTKALMPIHMFGQPADMDPILAIAREKGLAVVEDAACALGSEYRGRRCGGLSHVGCISFHPRKVITTGEGGMLVTNDHALAERLRVLRNHGQVTSEGRVRFEAAGFNYRMTEFQGAMGVAQMGRLASLIDRRTELASLYHQALEGIPELQRPTSPPQARCGWQSYVVLVAPGVDRDALRERLRIAGIETTIGTYSVSAQPHYAGRCRPLPLSGDAYARGLSLPLHTRMTDADVAVVANALRAALED